MSDHGDEIPVMRTCPCCGDEYNADEEGEECCEGCQNRQEPESEGDRADRAYEEWRETAIDIIKTPREP